MGMFDTYRLKKLLAAVLSARSASHPEAMRAISKLQGMGQAVVPKLVEGFAQAQNADVLVNALAPLLNNSTSSLLAPYLTHTNTRVVAGVTAVFVKSTAYDPNRLLNLLADPRAPHIALEQIFVQHRSRLQCKTLLSFLDRVDKEGQGIILRLLDPLATETAIPDLILQVRNDDAAIRFNIVRILTRFSTEAVRDTLVRLLGDPHTRVRQIALEGLGNMNPPLAVAPICHLLRDPDVAIQHKAKEILIKLHDPQVAQHLVDFLSDSDESIRRHAGEVLNATSNTGVIKVLLEALKGKESQVRRRAVVTLGTMGGPKLVEAILPLLKDDDEFVRSSTIELITITKDPQAFKELVAALQDPDTSVRQRAAEALAVLGDGRAVPPLMRMLDEDPSARLIALRALIALNDHQAVRPLLAQLPHSDTVTNQGIIQALATLADAEHAKDIWQTLMKLRQDADAETKVLINTTTNAIVSRLGDKAVFGDMSKDASPLTSTSPSLRLGRATPETMSLKAEPLTLNATVSDVSSDPTSPEAYIDATKLATGFMLEDRYRVIRLVGQGGFGAVVLVEDTMVGEEIVLKFLNPQVAIDANMFQRFVQELRYARRISHENVIRIYDFLTFGQSYAISMEYFLSHSLADELRDGKPLDTKRGLKIVWDICRGISSAHQAGIVHRDLKPPNVLIDDNNLVKVVDFGLAAASHAETRLTRTGVLLGTPTYMAPEQVRSRAIDARTDIYSLGVIMYEVFTGRPPYIGDDPMAVLFQHVEGKPQPPRSLQPTMSPALESIILKAMDIDPSKRFQSMDALRKGIVALTKAGTL